MLDYDTFAEHFRHNLNTRSRTSKGASDTSTSPDKPQLVGDEDYRVAKVAKNTESLIADVWAQRDSKVEAWSEHEFRSMVRNWAEINSRDLFDWYAYGEQVRVFCEGKGLNPFQFDPLWRTWNSEKYGYEHDTRIGPSLDQYCKLVEHLLLADRMQIDLATLLGTADYLQDGFIHAWADACGRTSVAVVMFLSLMCRHFEERVRLPRYPDRKSLYASFDQGTTGAIGFYAGCLVEV